MRHLTGIAAGIVMTAAIFGVATWGYVRFLAQSSGLTASDSLLSDHHGTVPQRGGAARHCLLRCALPVTRASPLRG
jgi:hypothetical protein